MGPRTSVMSWSWWSYLWSQGLGAKNTSKIWSYLNGSQTAYAYVSPHPIPSFSLRISLQGQGTNFSFTSNTALHWVAAKGHTRALRWLLAAGADPHARNAAESNPLHTAASNLQSHSMMVLVILGEANIQARNRFPGLTKNVLTGSFAPCQND